MKFTPEQFEGALNEVCKGLGPADQQWRVRYDYAAGEYLLTTYRGRGRDIKLQDHRLLSVGEIHRCAMFSYGLEDEYRRVFTLVRDRARLILDPPPRYRRFSRDAARKVPKP